LRKAITVPTSLAAKTSRTLIPNSAGLPPEDAA
jgi:hypothetical protein